MADRSQESYCSLVKVTVRGDDEPLLYRGELTLQGIDKAAAVSYCPLIVRSTPWVNCNSGGAVDDGRKAFTLISSMKGISLALSLQRLCILGI